MRQAGGLRITSQADVRGAGRRSAEGPEAAQKRALEAIAITSREVEVGVDAPMATPRYLHTATLLGNGKVLVTGGMGNSLNEPSAELYDSMNNTWTAVPSMSTGRFLHTATLLASGKVLVTGGRNDVTECLPSTELYDPLENSMTSDRRVMERDSERCPISCETPR